MKAITLTQLYLFDLDGTLISSYMDAADKNYHVWEVLPGRIERLQRILDNGDMYGIITNQAGVAFGHITESAVRYKLHQVAKVLGHAGARIFDGGVEFSTGNIHNADTGLLVWVCYADSRASDYRYCLDAGRRKPSGEMIREAALYLRYSYGEIVYIGDRPEDEQAARDAGVRFYWADEFFSER